jgi:hypothetical protein
MTQSEAMAYLGDQLFRDALASGKEWLVSTAKRDGKNGTVYYRAADVEMVSMKVAGGELPPVRAAKRGRKEAA